MKTIILITSILFLISCQSEEVSKPPVIKNKYPIEFIGNKILEFTKPVVYPMGGAPVKEDTFSVYTLRLVQQYHQLIQQYQECIRWYHQFI